LEERRVGGVYYFGASTDIYSKREPDLKRKGARPVVMTVISFLKYPVLQAYFGGAIVGAS